MPNEITWNLTPRECFCYLARNPFCCRISCDIDPNEVSAVQPNNDEGIKQVKSNGRNDEQVHGGNVRCVVTQESSPSLAWWATSFDHVLGDAGLSEFKAELEQFAMD